MSIYVWLYRSLETRRLAGDDIIDILSVSRLHNGTAGITGMLLYHDGRFTQAIEGAEADILALKARIAGDPRHKEVTTLYEGAQKDRVFAHWSMAFHRPDPGQQQLIEAYMPLGWGKRTLETTAATGDIATAFKAMAGWVSAA